VIRRIGLLLAVLAVAGCGAYQSSAPPRSATGNAVQPRTRVTAPTSLHVSLPHAWSSRSFFGGLGSDPHGLRVLVAANVSLPPSIAECETVIPSLSREQALVRIYDYGQSPLAPRAHRVGVLKPGAVSPVQQANGRVGGFNEARVSYDGHTLLIDTSYGSTHPPAAVRAQVAALLRGVGTG
jgi:hypothetical protein